MNFSVVIPLYNKAAYVINTIDAVLAQTFTSLEVIVVDDGSTDGGAELVAAITDTRVRLIRQSNAGVSAARNHGISLARGEWISFLDADDWHHPRYLETLLIVQNAHPEVDVVASEYIPLSDGDGIWPQAWPEVKKSPDVELITDLPHRWMAGPTLHTSAVAVRTSRLQKMQPCFAVGESRGEDLDMWFRLAEHSPIALIQTPLVAYRLEVEGSLTSHHGKMTMEPFMQRMRMRAVSGAMTASQRRSSLWLIAQFEVSMARQAIASGCRIEAFSWLFKGRRAALSKRWWLTAAMALFFPSQLIKDWEHWRIKRTVLVIDPSNAEPKA